MFNKTEFVPRSFADWVPKVVRESDHYVQIEDNGATICDVIDQSEHLLSLGFRVIGGAGGVIFCEKVASMANLIEKASS